MSDFLTRTAQLALGIGRRIEPLIAPRFAPPESLAMPRDDTFAPAAAEEAPQQEQPPRIEEQAEERPPVPRAPVIRTEPEAPTVHEESDVIAPVANAPTVIDAAAPIATPREDRVEIRNERTRRPLPSPQTRAEQLKEPASVEQVEEGGHAVASPGSPQKRNRGLLRHPERVEGPGWEGGAEKDNELAAPPPGSLDTLGMTAITQAPSPALSPSPTTAPASIPTSSEPTREHQQQTPREHEQRQPAPPTEPFLRETPRGAPTASRRESASASMPNDEPPPVIVEIGRIEIINPAPPPPPAAPPPGLSPMTLDGYLSRRKGRA